MFNSNTAIDHAQFLWIFRIFPPGALPQRPRMVRQMLADKTGDEVVTVVIARLHPQSERMPGCGAGGLQAFGLELAG